MPEDKFIVVVTPKSGERKVYDVNGEDKLVSAWGWFTDKFGQDADIAVGKQTNVDINNLDPDTKYEVHTNKDGKSKVYDATGSSLNGAGRDWFDKTYGADNWQIAPEYRQMTPRYGDGGELEGFDPWRQPTRTEQWDKDYGKEYGDLESRRDDPNHGDQFRRFSTEQGNLTDEEWDRYRSMAAERERRQGLDRLEERSKGKDADWDAFADFNEKNGARLRELQDIERRYRKHPDEYRSAYEGIEEELGGLSREYERLSRAAKKSEKFTSSLDLQKAEFDDFEKTLDYTRDGILNVRESYTPTGTGTAIRRTDVSFRDGADREGYSDDAREVLHHINMAKSFDLDTQLTLNADSDSFFSGAGTVAKDPNTYLANIPEAVRNIQFRKLVDKMMEGGGYDSLTKDEQLVVDAWQRNAEAHALLDPMRSSWFKGGQGAAQSIEFMVEMALTGGIIDAASKGVLKAALEKGLIRGGKELAGKTMLEGLSGLATKGLTGEAKYLAGQGVRFAGGLVKGTVQAALNVPMQLRTFGDELLTFDENGNLPTWGEARKSALFQTWAETYTENGVEPIWNVLTHYPMKWAGLAMRSFLPGAYRGLAEMYTKARVSGLGRMMRAGGFQGLNEEVFEELMNAVIYEAGGEKGAVRDFFTRDNLETLYISFAPITLIGGGASMAQVGMAQRNYNNQRAGFEKMLGEYGFDKNQTALALDNILSDPVEGHRGLLRSIYEQAALEGCVDKDGNLTGRWGALGNKMLEFRAAAAQKAIYDGAWESEQNAQMREEYTRIFNAQGGDFLYRDSYTDNGQEGTSFSAEERAIQEGAEMADEVREVEEDTTSAPETRKERRERRRAERKARREQGLGDDISAEERTQRTIDNGRVCVVETTDGRTVYVLGRAENGEWAVMPVGGGAMTYIGDDQIVKGDRTDEKGDAVRDADGNVQKMTAEETVRAGTQSLKEYLSSRLLLTRRQRENAVANNLKGQARRARSEDIQRMMGRFYKDGLWGGAFGQDGEYRVADAQNDTGTGLFVYKPGQERPEMMTWDEIYGVLTGGEGTLASERQVDEMMEERRKAEQGELPTEQERTEAERSVSALERLPKDENGNPVFERAESPAQALDALTEAVGDGEQAANMAVTEAADATRAAQEATKKADEAAKEAQEAKTNPKGKTINEKIANLNKAKAAEESTAKEAEEAARRAEFWQGVAREAAERRNAGQARTENTQQQTETQQTETPQAQTESRQQERKEESKEERDRREFNALVDAARELLEKLNVPYRMITSREELLTMAEAEGSEFYDQIRAMLNRGTAINAFVRKGEVWFYAPQIFDDYKGDARMAKARQTIAHEVIAHIGLKNLKNAQKEGGFAVFCRDVYGKVMTARDRERYLAYHWNVNLSDAEKRRMLGLDGNAEVPRWESLTAEQRAGLFSSEYGDSIVTGAADEYIASIAEKIERGEAVSSEERTAWQRFMDWLSRLFGAEMTESDVVDALLETRRSMEGGQTETAQETENKASKGKSKPLSEARIGFATTTTYRGYDRNKETINGSGDINGFVSDTRSFFDRMNTKGGEAYYCLLRGDNGYILNILVPIEGGRGGDNFSTFIHIPFDENVSADELKSFVESVTEKMLNGTRGDDLTRQVRDEGTIRESSEKGAERKEYEGEELHERMDELRRTAKTADRSGLDGLIGEITGEMPSGRTESTERKGAEKADRKEDRGGFGQVHIRGGIASVAAQRLKKKLTPKQVQKIHLENFTDDDKSHIRPVLESIYYKDGYAYSSNSHILIKARMDYPAEWEGKIINPRTGKQIEGKYPNAESVLDGFNSNEDVVRVSPQELLDALGAAQEVRKGATNKNYKISSDDVLVALDSTNGAIGGRDYKTLIISSKYAKQLSDVIRNCENVEVYAEGSCIRIVADGVETVLMRVNNGFKDYTARDKSVIYHGRTYLGEGVADEMRNEAERLRNEAENLFGEPKEKALKKADRIEGILANAGDLKEFEAEDDLGEVKDGTAFSAEERGYEGRSQSTRAKEARKEGKFPMTDFTREYDIPKESVSLLTGLGLIDDSEWHHTGPNYARTTFYGWSADGALEAYRDNKKEIDRLAREYSAVPETELRSDYGYDRDNIVPSLMSESDRRAYDALLDEHRHDGNYDGEEYDRRRDEYARERERLFAPYRDTEEYRRNAEAVDRYESGREENRARRESIEGQAREVLGETASMFSAEERESMTPKQIDDEYFRAMEAGDEARMREMLDEVARRNGYGKDNGWRSYHTAPSRGEAAEDGTLYTWTLKDVADGAQVANDISDSYYASADINGSRDESMNAIQDALSAIRRGEDPTVTIYRAVPKDIEEGRVRNGDWVTMSRAYAEEHGQHVLGIGDYRIIKEQVPASQLYWDGNDINEWGFDDQQDYRYRNTKNNRKLDDLVTRDDDGNVIPPSRRFDSRNADTRFSAEERDIIDKARKEGKLGLAPNGRQSNLYNKYGERVWAMVRTPQFKDWFGDWEKADGDSSKVVDENGEPLVVYHGSRTGGEFSTFDGTTFFTDNEDVAEVFRDDAPYYVRVNGRERILRNGWDVRNVADYISGYDYTPEELFGNGTMRVKEDWNWDNLEESEKEDIRYLLGMDEDEDLETLSIMPAQPTFETFLNIRNPYIIDFNGQEWLPNENRPEASFEKAREEGHDGMIVRNIVEGGPSAMLLNGDEVPAATDYVTFIPNQIKSVDNSGDFSTENDDIRFSAEERGDDRMTVRNESGFTMTERERRETAEYLMGDNYASELTGNEFPRGEESLVKRVVDYYDKNYNGKVFREGIGEVVLNGTGVWSSIRHGLRRNKVVAFAAVPEIITKGRIIDTNDNWEGKGYDSVTIAAPIKIKQGIYIGTVIITKGKNASNFRFYLHKVNSQKSLLNEQANRVFSTNAIREEGTAKVLRNILSPNINSENVNFSAEERELSDADTRFSVTPKDEIPTKTGKAYKVFVLKDGKLYPPKVNPSGEATPVGTWVTAEAAPIAGTSKTGRAKVKATDNGLLANRPGWHLGEIPYAIQFNRMDGNRDRTLFPADFVWAECEYDAGTDYAEEAHNAGINAAGNFQHSLASLDHLPEGGFYKYRTNPDPRTDDWIITDKMRVNRILTDGEVDDLVRQAGREPQTRQTRNNQEQRDKWIEELNRQIGETEETADQKETVSDIENPEDDDRFSAEERIATANEARERLGVELTPEELASTSTRHGAMMIALRKATEDGAIPGMDSDAVLSFLSDTFRDAPEEIKSGIWEVFSESANPDIAGEVERSLADYVSREVRGVELAPAQREFLGNAARTIAGRLGISEDNAKYVLWQHANAGNDLVTDEERQAMRNALGVSTPASDYEAGVQSELRFSAAREDSNDSAAEMYSRAMGRVAGALNEVGFNEYRAIDSLVEAVSKQTGREYTGWDPRKAFNQLTSNVKARIEAYLRDYFDPMSRMIDGISRKRNISKDKLAEYAALKHGLERNRVLHERDTREAEEKKRKAPERRDYSGLGEWMREYGEYATLDELEAAAQAKVDEYEEILGDSAGELWDAVRAATAETLRIQLRNGLITRETYDRISSMFEYYVPLQGFAEDTNEDKYEYMGGFHDGSTGTIGKRAKGRKSRAANPFARIGLNAQKTIMEAEKNRAKQALYYFLRANSDNDLTSFGTVWYVKTGRKEGDKDVWEVSAPALTGGETAEEIRSKIGAWEEEMRGLEEQGLAKRERDRLDLGDDVVFTYPQDVSEHSIDVLVDGYRERIYVNGDPRAAQAANGLLRTKNTAFERFLKRASRYTSTIYTSGNPQFFVTNFARDIGFATFNVYSKEGMGYLTRFLGNALRCAQIGLLSRKFRNGNADADRRMQRLYGLFAMNGGITGYSQVRGEDYFEKEIEKSLGAGHWLWKALTAIPETFRTITENGENLLRFAAFLTSYRDGRGKSLTDSIADAKDVTVNFNRRGTGRAISAREAERLIPGDGVREKAARLALQAASGLLSVGPAYSFFNVSMQGMSQLFKNMRQYPQRSVPVLVCYAGLGLLNGIIHGCLNAAMGGDAPDPDDPFYNIPDWERRTNFIIQLPGGNYIKIPISQELRPFYALGDMIGARLAHKTAQKDLPVELLSLFGEMLPINPLGEGGLGQSLAPTIASPAVDLMVNRDYRGLNIIPERYGGAKGTWLYSYGATPDWAVAASRALNGVLPMLSMTDIDRKRMFEREGFWKGMEKGLYSWNRGDSGVLDVSPEAVQHLAEGYAGGLLTFVSMCYETAESAAKGEDVNFRRVPYVNRFYGRPQDRQTGSYLLEMNRYAQKLDKRSSAKMDWYLKNIETDEAVEFSKTAEFYISALYSGFKDNLKKINEAMASTDDEQAKMTLIDAKNEMLTILADWMEEKLYDSTVRRSYKELNSVGHRYDGEVERLTKQTNQ